MLAAFTAPEAPTSSAFRSIGDFNIANACPLLRTPTGDYVSLQSYGVVEALYDSPSFWMRDDKAYRNKASEHRGAFTEAFVARRLAAVFGDAHVHRSVNIEGKEKRVGEIDVFVLFADRAVVIQCKSKKLTLEARKGSDLQLRDDFKKAIQDAYNQAQLCAKALEIRACHLSAPMERQSKFQNCVKSTRCASCPTTIRRLLRRRGSFSRTRLTRSFTHRSSATCS